MPFANKFRAMMDFPFAGDALGDFCVKSIDVRHESRGPGLYAYSARIVLRGPGGQRGVRQTLRTLFSAHPTTFSGFGNPYQLWFGRPEIKSLGDKRYEVSIEGAGARVFIEDELHRFLAYLDQEGQLADQPDRALPGTLVEMYLERYRAEIRRKVDRYRSKLRKSRDDGS